MNTKKLIGMIIGVTLFAALIAGATFAWFTYTATVQNATNTFTSRNFTFTSPTGTALGRQGSSGTESVLQFFAGMPARNKFTAGNDYVVLNLSKAADVPYASSVKIYLKKADNTVTLPYSIKYAVCRSSTASQCNNSVSTVIPTSASTSNWVVVPVSNPGSSSATFKGYIDVGNGDQLLWDDTASKDGTSSTNSPFKSTGAASTSYYVYFWVDSELVNNDNSSQILGKHIYGNVYFEATQGANQ